MKGKKDLVRCKLPEKESKRPRCAYLDENPFKYDHWREIFKTTEL